MKTRDFSKIFFAILFLHLAVIYKPDSEALYLVSKPLLLFALLAFFISQSKGFLESDRKPIIAALTFSLMGDVLLLGDDQLFFLGGMAAFGIAHVVFSLFYFKQKLETKKSMLLLASVVLGAVAFILLSYVNLPSELSPYIYGYAVIIGIHFILSIRLLSSGVAKAKLAVLGALLFVISDLILAYNHFGEQNKYWHIAVMLTYGLAQYCITMGLIEYLKSEEAISEHLEV